MVGLLNPVLHTNFKSLLWRLALVTALLIAVFVQFQPTLHSYFMADDFRLLRFAREYENPLNIAVARSPWGFATFIPNVVIWVLFRLFGTDPQGYYLFNALLHL